MQRINADVSFHFHGSGLCFWLDGSIEKLGRNSRPRAAAFRSEDQPSRVAGRAPKDAGERSGVGRGDDTLDPVAVVGNLGVDAKLAPLAAALAEGGDAVDVPGGRHGVS